MLVSESLVFANPGGGIAQTVQVYEHAGADPIVQAGGYSREGSDESLTVRRGYNGRIRRVLGERFAIPLADLGCEHPTVQQQARCFLAQYGEPLGVLDQANELTLSAQKALLSGVTMVTFDQVAGGYPVFGGRVTVHIDSTPAVVSVGSTMRAPIITPSQGSLGPAFSALDLQTASASIAAHLGETAVEIWPAGELLYVDVKHGSAQAVPAHAFNVYRPGGSMRIQLVLVSASTGQVLWNADTTAFNWPRGMLYGSAEHLEVKGQCHDDGDCDEGWICSGEYPVDSYYKYCVQQCQQDEDCPENWRCLTAGATLYGYCHVYPDPDDPRRNGKLVLDTDQGGWGGWTEGDLHRHHIGYQRVHDNLRDVVSWWTVHLGVDREDFPHPYVLNILTFCDCGTDDVCNLDDSDGDGCSSAWQCDWEVCLPGWYWDYVTNFNEAHPWRISATLAHEFSHVVLSYIHNQRPPLESTGLRESIPEMLGNLYSEWRISGQDSWQDCRSGLQRGACHLGGGWHPMPYAQRSHFDWLGTDIANLNEVYLGSGSLYDCDADWTLCPPYHFCDQRGTDFWCTTNDSAYNNIPIWLRFLRVLSEGTAVLENDDEHIFEAISYSGVGIDVAQQILFDAAVAYGAHIETATLHDWVDDIIDAGYQHGYADQVRKLLGATGFFVSSNVPVYERTDRGPRETWFSSWEVGNSNYFQIWREEDTENLKVRYDYYGDQTTGTIPNANAVARPAVAEYKGSLYIFWAEPDGGIRYYVFDKWGHKYGPFGLDVQGLYTNGAFEATVAHGRLYLVFAYKGDDNLRVAYCNLSNCYQASLWHKFGAEYSLDLGYGQAVYPGASAVGASYVNGAGADKGLYIAFAHQSDELIGVLAVDDQNAITDVLMMPADPPFRATTKLPLGITVRPSAFPDTSGGGLDPRNYLYLVFVTQDEESMLTSVLQNAGPSDPWLTVPVDTGVRALHGTGASWRIEPGLAPQYTDPYAIIHAGENAYPTRLISYGRY